MILICGFPLSVPLLGETLLEPIDVALPFFVSICARVFGKEDLSNNQP